MKTRIFTILTLLLFVLISFSQTAFAGDRKVLVERFTSSTCPPCASNNPIMDAFLQAQNPDQIVGISYHMNWPAPGNDPFYLYNPGDNTARRNYYNVNSIPQAYMGGMINIQPPYNQGTLTAYFNSRKDSLSPVTIIVQDSTFGDSALVRIKVYCETPVPSPVARLYAVVVEKYKHFTSPPGTNGETDFRDIMRKILPNNNGVPITLFPGQTQTFEYRYYMDPVWQANQMRTVVFVQSSGQEILNSATSVVNFSMLSDTSFKVVNQGQSQSADYEISVPVVASGYNSPVTLAASVDPPVSGLTTSFTSGNVINNFPGSVTLHVSSSSAVPTGIYRIVVTGTDTSSAVHKTVLSYLVGKSYIFVGTNRTGLQFKVDNTTYTNAQFFTWDLNSSHTLAAIQPQGAGSVRYLFESWSNNGDSVQNVTITPAVNRYIVNYKIQYKLVTLANPYGITPLITISGGNDFYDSSSVANLSVTPLHVQYNNMTYYFQRWEGTGNGSYTGPEPSVQITMNNVIAETCVWDTIPPIGVKGLGNEIPKTYSLNQNYPNPFNPATIIKYALPVSGYVTLKIYDILGNEVYTLDDSYRKAGYYEVLFDASNLASGVYFYKLVTDRYIATKKMLLIK
jgi:thiol-disulfide isomerase/thioredoxin